MRPHGLAAPTRSGERRRHGRQHEVWSAAEPSAQAERCASTSLATRRTLRDGLPRSPHRRPGSDPAVPDGRSIRAPLVRFLSPSALTGCASLLQGSNQLPCSSRSGVHARRRSPMRSSAMAVVVAVCLGLPAGSPVLARPLPRDVVLRQTFRRGSLLGRAVWSAAGRRTLAGRSPVRRRSWGSAALRSLDPGPTVARPLDPAQPACRSLDSAPPFSRRTLAPNLFRCVTPGPKGPIAVSGHSVGQAALRALLPWAFASSRSSDASASFTVGRAGRVSSPGPAVGCGVPLPVPSAPELDRPFPATCSSAALHTDA